MDTLAPRLPATTSTAPGRTATLALLLCGGLTVGLGLLLVVASPAAAHDNLVSSSPADGEVLGAAPPLVELTFSGDVTELGSALVIEEASGALVQDAPLAIEGPVARSPMPADLGPGTYLVRWRVVSEDGHPVEGTFGFAVSDEAAPGTAAPAGAPGDPPTGSATDTPTTDESSPAPSGEDGTGAEVDVSSLGPVFGALLGLGALAGVIVVLVRRRRS